MMTRPTAAVTGVKVGGEAGLKVARLLDDADCNVRFVKLVHGVHNPNYASAMLNAAINNCKQATEIIKTGVEKP